MGKKKMAGRLRAKRTYKDTLFRMLFREKENLLSLYNAVNGTTYSNPEELHVVTLENAVYMNMKNDLAFILDCGLNLYEHQASVNPNMPLRNQRGCQTWSCLLLSLISMQGITRIYKKRARHLGNICNL